MEIRQITLDDIPAVYRLGKKSFIDNKKEESFVYGYWSLQQLAQMIEEYPHLMLVATEEGKIAGFVLGHPTYEGILNIGYLEWIAVDPEFMRQGLATRLIESLLEIYKEKGETRIVTDVKGVNVPSMKLFQNKFGFEVRETVSFLVKQLE